MTIKTTLRNEGRRFINYVSKCELTRQHFGLVLIGGVANLKSPVRDKCLELFIIVFAVLCVSPMCHLLQHGERHLESMTTALDKTV